MKELNFGYEKQFKCMIGPFWDTYANLKRRKNMVAVSHERVRLYHAQHTFFRLARPNFSRSFWDLQYRLSNAFAETKLLLWKINLNKMQTTNL